MEDCSDVSRDGKICRINKRWKDNKVWENCMYEAYGKEYSTDIVKNFIGNEIITVFESSNNIKFYNIDQLSNN